VVLAVLAVLVAAGVWWYRSGSPQATLAVGETATAVAFSPDGAVLATGSSGPSADRPGADGIIRLWEVGTYRPIATWVAHGDFVTHLAFDSAGRTLTSAAVVRGDDPVRWEVKVWDVCTHKEIERSQADAPPGGFPVVSPTGRFVAKHGGWGVLALCDAGTGAELYRVEADGRQLNCAAFSSDGTLLATGGGDTTGGGPAPPIPGANGYVRVWEVGTGRLLVSYGRHSGPIEGVAFSPDGRWVASASLDGTVKVWAVPGR
jgi:WD40 repeat protein